MVDKDRNTKRPVSGSACMVEPYSGEYYCHCREFRRFVHIPSEHAELRTFSVKEEQHASTR
jgi:hypothetical protein